MQQKLLFCEGFIATGARVALDKSYLQTIPILRPARSFLVNNSSLDSPSGYSLNSPSGICGLGGSNNKDEGRVPLSLVLTYIYPFAESVLPTTLKVRTR